MFTQSLRYFVATVLIILGIFLVFNATAFADPSMAGNLSAAHYPQNMPKNAMNVRTTAYTHTEADHIQYAKSTAAGGTLRCEPSYTSAASDWSVFPVGTTFRIRGIDRVFVIDDYGSALVGSETIDMYHPTKASMNRWGVQHVQIEILEFGSYERSLKILSGRLKYKHCKAMYDAIVAKRQLAGL